MSFSLSRIGQIAMAVANLDRAEAFYEGTLGLRKLYRFDDLTYFDCAGVRLLLEKAHKPENVNHASTLYFICADIALAFKELRRRGAASASAGRRIRSRKWTISTYGWCFLKTPTAIRWR